jgi:hypothetical protein
VSLRSLVRSPLNGCIVLGQASMPNEPTNSSWSEALALYASLEGPAWQHIPAFRQLVAAISAASVASGLTAVASHETLTISPYTRYPDWFEGRHVRLHPLADGRVRIDRFPKRFDRRPAETWTLSLEETRERIIGLLADL